MPLRNTVIAYSRLNGSNRQLGSLEKVEALRDELQSVLAEDQRQHVMDEELLGLSDAIDEFCSIVDAHVNFDRTPHFLYDNDGGEPGVGVRNAAERLIS
jgi:hypothetical protein